MNVVLIVSSSRGGSSIFAETFRHARNLRHLPGEVNPLLRLAGLDAALTGSDALDATHATLPAAARFRALLDTQLGTLADAPGAGLPAACLTRLSWQWPDVDFDPDRVATAVTNALPRLPDTGAFTRAVVEGLSRYYPVFPGRYDIPLAPGEAVAGPPARVVEEPPFIQLAPWQLLADPAVPVVLKSPSNAYRLDFFQALFPSLRLVHLHRNPASAITGLLDGWAYPGFHAHDVGGLAIRGYSEVQPGGDRWWKYDLPPGWERLRAAPLGEVCAWQWSSAHDAILDWRARHPEVPALDLRFEDFLTAPIPVIEKACAWIGVPVDARLRAASAAGLPPVMATSRPRQRRWFARAAEIEPLVATVQTTSERLGYGDSAEWI